MNKELKSLEAIAFQFNSNANLAAQRRRECEDKHDLESASFWKGQYMAHSSNYRLIQTLINRIKVENDLLD